MPDITGTISTVGRHETVTLFVFVTCGGDEGVVVVMKHMSRWLSFPGNICISRMMCTSFTTGSSGVEELTTSRCWLRNASRRCNGLEESDVSISVHVNSTSGKVGSTVQFICDMSVHISGEDGHEDGD